MAGLMMKPADLAELHELLKLYCSSYGDDPGGLLDRIESEYKAACRVYGQEPDIKNPRGAGRKRTVTDAQRERVLQLRAEGQAIRAIAAETGLSVGTVQNLIFEHGRK